MSKKKEELGRGVRALLSNIKSNPTPETKKEVVKDLTATISEIEITNIEPNPFQPRIEFKPQDLEELAHSIKTHGVIQPITVRSVGGNKFQIISGERRWRASQMAGKKSIPAYVRIADDQGLLEMAIVENVQRADLNAIEVAVSFQRLIDECSLSHEEMADRVGKNRSTVTNYLRLLKLPPSLQLALKENTISMGHARALIPVEPTDAQLDIFNRVIRDNLSVRATESLIQNLKDSFNKKTSASTNKKSEENPEVQKIKRQLSAHFGSKVDIKRNAQGKGSFIIHFGSDDEFNEILDIFEV